MFYVERERRNLQAAATVNQNNVPMGRRRIGYFECVGMYFIASTFYIKIMVRGVAVGYRTEYCKNFGPILFAVSPWKVDHKIMRFYGKHTLHKIHNKFCLHFHGLEPGYQKVHETNIIKPRRKYFTTYYKFEYVREKRGPDFNVCLSYGNFIQNVNNKQTQHLKVQRAKVTDFLQTKLQSPHCYIDNLGVRIVLPLRQLYSYLMRSKPSLTLGRMPFLFFFIQ